MRLELIQRIMLIWDEAALVRVAKTIEEAAPNKELYFTTEDLAELDRRRARHWHGEGGAFLALRWGFFRLVHGERSMYFSK